MCNSVNICVCVYADEYTYVLIGSDVGQRVFEFVHSAYVCVCVLLNVQPSPRACQVSVKGIKSSLFISFHFTLFSVEGHCILINI